MNAYAAYDFTATVTYVGSSAGRDTYAYTLTADGVTHSGSDLNGPTGMTSPCRMLDTLASFLLAWQESREYGTADSENWDLFPASALPFLPYAYGFSLDMSEHMDRPDECGVVH